ncbi:DUF3805 domain-containing protein [Flavobacterium gelatinilyticum]|uniref:DUF3805 domain-containing protein n=1 Tax=Flavobacterium gelatinilyticum TaxID=3003260 RepID=UPI0024817A8C|nr:DUF3805 domain-containing protein [Flavobacterium gelatinilyticum]
MSCISQSKSQKFTSEFDYSIILPENWTEYEDEENVDAFFDTTKWTGNFRISVVKINKKVDRKFIEDDFQSHDYAKKISTKNGLEGFKYSENSRGGKIYYWHLFKNAKVYICSFLINPENNATINEIEIEKVGKIINSIKTDLE